MECLEVPGACEATAGGPQVMQKGDCVCEPERRGPLRRHGARISSPGEEGTQSRPPYQFCPLPPPSPSHQTFPLPLPSYQPPLLLHFLISTSCFPSIPPPSYQPLPSSSLHPIPDPSFSLSTYQCQSSLIPPLPPFSQSPNLPSTLHKNTNYYDTFV